MQIRTRLTIQFIILVAGILLLSLCFIFYEFKKMNEDEFFSTLRSKALMTAEMILHDEDQLTTIENNQENTSSLPFDDNIMIFNQNWEKIFAFDRSNNSTPNLDFDDNENEICKKEGTTYTIGLRYRSKKGNPYFVVAESKLNTYQVENLRNILILTFLIITVLVAIGGWFYTGEALAPVSKIISQVDSILPKNLEARLSASKSKDEIGRLVTTFNNLLERIHNAFTLQKNFISNVSHEIKNPVAVIISQIEVVLGQKQRSSEEYKNTLESVLNDAYDLSDTTENLLQLARLQSTEHESPQFTEVQLDEIILAARRNLLRTHKDYNILFEIIGTPDNENDLRTSGNEMLLRAVFANLMDNACKYSNDKTAIVHLIVGEKNNIIEVIDHSQGIAEKDIPLLLKPFYRDPKHVNTRGTGIGLSLVDSILRLHKVALQIKSKEGEGSVFKMEFEKNAN